MSSTSQHVGKDAKVRIISILDASGSMQGSVEATLDGYNGIIAEQRKLLEEKPGQVEVDLVLFNGRIGPRTLYARRPLLQVEPLSRREYAPDGNTPLLDTVGETITGVHDEADTAYLIITITDGLENASHKWTGAALQDLIQGKEATDRWTFLYLGTHADAWHESRAMGYAAGSSARAGSVESAFDVARLASRRYREGKFARGVSAPIAEPLKPEDGKNLEIRKD